MIMPDVKVSVIVPVFNVAPYISRCIESLQKQSLKEIEIILVDDGSTDGSGKICDEFSKDPRITVLHKENGGLSSARNAGISAAKGKYLGFVDGDDWVEEDMYKELYDLAETQNAEIAECSYWEVINGRTENKEEGNSFTVLEQEEALKRFFLREATESVWNKIFLRNLFNDLKFPVGEINEDTTIVIRLLLKSKKVIFSEKKLYFYRIREGSITKSGYSPRFRVVDRHMQEIEALTDEKYPRLKPYREYFFGVHYYCLVLSVLKDSSRKEYQQDYVYYLRQFQRFFLSFMRWGTGKPKDRILAVLLVFRCGPLLYGGIR